MAHIIARFQQQVKASETSDRSFGWVIGAAFLAVGILPVLRRHPVRWWAVAGGVALFLIAAIAPAVLRKPKQAWLFLGSVLGFLVSPIVLGVLFFFAITPISFLLRLVGRDALHLKRDPQAKTYWQTRDEPPSDMGLQF
jgi:hypothetical protein